ncbi:MAG TPA: AbrB/MazE/SpoVT family DNA-binding domain-containing protein [Acidobacteriaceae bacterium]
MQAQLRKWGNSVAVRLPKAALQAARLVAGDVVELEVPEEGSIVVRARPARQTLEKLVARITPENLHGETLKSRPVGKEVW